MEELLGLWAREETPMATRLLFLALAGLVEGKPMRITLWMGANRPNLGRHWKYLQGESEGEEEAVWFSLGIQKGLLATWVHYWSSEHYQTPLERHKAFQTESLSNTWVMWNYKPGANLPHTVSLVASQVKWSVIKITYKSSTTIVRKPESEQEHSLKYP